MWFYAFTLLRDLDSSGLHHLNAAHTRGLVADVLRIELPHPRARTAQRKYTKWGHRPVLPGCGVGRYPPTGHDRSHGRGARSMRHSAHVGESGSSSMRKVQVRAPQRHRTWAARKVLPCHTMSSSSMTCVRYAFVWIERPHGRLGRPF